MGTPPNKDMLAGAQGTDRYKQFQSNLANSGFGNWTRPTTPPDPATLAAWQKLVPGSGVQVNAGTPPPTVPAGAPLPPTTNDAAMGPSYMPAQPSMAGAPVNSAPPPAPAAPKAPTPKKPTTPDPAKSTGIDPKIQQQAWDMFMRGGSMGGGSYGYNAATSKAFGDAQRQMLALGQNANPETKAMISALNQRMVDQFNRTRGGARQGGSR
jgi:hypothetical protein